MTQENTITSGRLTLIRLEGYENPLFGFFPAVRVYAAEIEKKWGILVVTFSELEQLVAMVAALGDLSLLDEAVPVLSEVRAGMVPDHKHLRQILAETKLPLIDGERFPHEFRSDRGAFFEESGNFYARVSPKFHTFWEGVEYYYGAMGQESFPPLLLRIISSGSRCRSCRWVPNKRGRIPLSECSR